MAWRLWDHTADVGIEAEGDDAGECLAQAAHALTALVAGHGKPLPMRPGKAVDFTVEAPDHEALAVAFLSELLYLMETEDRYWTSGGVDVTSGEHGLLATASANLAGFDAAHGRGVEVKAVTYHGIRFGRQGNQWHLKVILDI